MGDEGTTGFRRDFQLFWPQEPQSRNTELVGEKAAYLSRLGHVFGVPRGFSVTALSYHDLPAPDRDAVLNAAVAAYRELSRDAGLAVAVRPSPPPGMTRRRPPAFLNIRGHEALSSAVTELLAWPMPSRGWAPGLPGHAIGGLGRRALLIQDLVAAESYARVYLADTASPDSDIIVRATWGLGENLAKESEPADVFVFDTGLRLLSYQVAVKERMIALAAGGVTEVAVMNGLRLRPSLSETLSRRMARQLQRAQQLLGRSVRLGMAVVGDEISTVSCRPS
ncbi:PEP/pyruvate-binding domain-containing protein [Nonomuraea insulae]|uniref:PEP/pyruvate-binding domain-containing protein n=1 Tax=Nonomuraea insulae TaxID=1616787 RepID=A0ABW1CQD1_9ACTN